MAQIRFGTSGWRGILAEDFTFDNVRVVTQAIADHLKAYADVSGGVVVGHDSRFMGQRFAHEAARILAGAGVKAWVCAETTPTPVIAHAILQKGACGGINFTASHNPSDYNGLKFSPASGGPALPETTADIEARANAMLGEICYREMRLDEAVRTGLVEEFDPRSEYVEAVRRQVDFQAIASGKLKVACDPMFGAGIGYVDKLLEEAGAEVTTIHNTNDPTFGGAPPDPGEAHLGRLSSLVADTPEISLGLATDGDADRYGIVDRDGQFIEPNYVLALLADYMIRVRGEKGALARSVATSHLLDRVAKHHGVELLETPVGFKYIGDYISQNRILIGGEESAGLTVRGHVPDKDGIVACLLVAEMVAVTGCSLVELLEDLYRRVGPCYTRRDNLHLNEEQEESLSDRLSVLQDGLAGSRVKDVILVDGHKFVLEDGTWLLFRKSGTEPVVRIYGEADSEERLEELMEAGRAFVLG